MLLAWTSHGTTRSRVAVDLGRYHYNDVIMGAMASQITSLSIVNSSVYSGADQRKHQSSASLAFPRLPVKFQVHTGQKNLVKQVRFGSSDLFLENAWEEWPEIFACWCILTRAELIRFWSGSGEFPHFGGTLTKWAYQLWGFREFSWERVGRMAWNLAY